MQSYAVINKKDNTITTLQGGLLAVFNTYMNVANFITAQLQHVEEIEQDNGDSILLGYPNNPVFTIHVLDMYTIL